MAIGMWYCEKCGKKTCGKCCEDEPPKIRTNYEQMQQMKQALFNQRGGEMTTKERQKMARLESENRQLREEIAKHMRIYGDTLSDLITAMARLESAMAALVEE